MRALIPNITVTLKDFLTVFSMQSWCGTRALLYVIDSYGAKKLGKKYVKSTLYNSRNIRIPSSKVCPELEAVSFSKFTHT